MKKFILSLIQSSIGRKFIMGITGGGLVLFIFGHLAGNLFFYAGKNGEGINIYAHYLHSIPFLPLIEYSLAALFMVHIFFGLWLTYENWRARPIGYIKNVSAGARTLASSTMIYTGLIILGFVLYHLYGMEYSKYGPDQTYTKVITILKVLQSFIIYLIGVIAVGTHMFHGISSIFQTLGLRFQKYDKIPDVLGPVVAVLITLAFASIPLSVYLMKGVVK